MPKGIKKINPMENKEPKLNFPPIKLRAQPQGDRTLVFDQVRGMYVVLTPEERVRRYLVAYLISHCGVPLRSIVEEYPVELNGMAQRADVVVFGPDAQPWLLVECKAPDVKITQETTLQATRYNAVVGARYVILTNGLLHYCYEKTEEGYLSRPSFPQFG